MPAAVLEDATMATEGFADRAVLDAAEMVQEGQEAEAGEDVEEELAAVSDRVC